MLSCLARGRVIYLEAMRLMIHAFKEKYIKCYKKSTFNVNNVEYVAFLRSLIVEYKNLGCNVQIFAYFVILIVLGKTRLASVGYVCLYLAYIWQILRSDRRYLSYIWQTHAVKTQKCTPNWLFPKKKCPYTYISEKPHVKKQNLPYITQMRPGCEIAPGRVAYFVDFHLGVKSKARVLCVVFRSPERKTTIGN